jgi:hypothetical protein
MEQAHSWYGTGVCDCRLNSTPPHWQLPSSFLYPTFRLLGKLASCAWEYLHWHFEWLEYSQYFLLYLSLVDTLSSRRTNEGGWDFGRAGAWCGRLAPGDLWLRHLAVPRRYRNLKLPASDHSRRNWANMSTFGSPGGRQINSKPTP